MKGADMKRTGLLLSCLLMLNCLSGCAFVNVPLVSPSQPLEEQVLEGDGPRKILLLDISGTVSEQEKSSSVLGQRTPSMVSQVREALQKAEHDREISGLILRINSPGGGVTASDIIHDISQFRKRKNIPVQACIMAVGASGGYYIAAAADEITGHPTSITGSIGVLLMKFNLAGLMGKIGVEEQSVKSGDKKDILSPFRRATPEEERLAKEIIDQLHGRFLDVIMERPGNRLTRDQLKMLADGRIYTAGQARQAGLIDRVGYLDDVIAVMRRKVGDGRARVVSYFRPGNPKGSIYAGADARSEMPVAELLGGMNALSGGSFMYIWRP